MSQSLSFPSQISVKGVQTGSGGLIGSLIVFGKLLIASPPPLSKQPKEKTRNKIRRTEIIFLCIRLIYAIDKYKSLHL
ncbi:MAG: hypothetical protein COT90_04545 [Candidatus Diapherotrites archaeon CG10_big_fil_rev_8_21_14_0_10_31_34]|nr:MAG: hypothetical protein COT90_04545 [Candidatus Diapherotrites archaeon CG10_big_fil_rev_8_21_14_0_10_31_34]